MRHHGESGWEHSEFSCGPCDNWNGVQSENRDDGRFIVNIADCETRRWIASIVFVELWRWEITFNKPPVSGEDIQVFVGDLLDALEFVAQQANV